MEYFCKLSRLRDDLCMFIEDKGINKHLFKHPNFINGLRIMVYDLVIKVNSIGLSLLFGTVETVVESDHGLQRFAALKNSSVIIYDKGHTVDVAFTEADEYIKTYLKDHDIIAYGDINIKIDTVETDLKTVYVNRLINGWEKLMDQMVSAPLNAERFKYLYKEAWSHFAFFSKLDDFALETMKLINTLHRFNWLLYGPASEAVDIAERFDMWNVYWASGILIDALLENITRPEFIDESIEEDLLIMQGGKKRIVSFDSFEEAFDDLCASWSKTSIIDS